MAHSRHHMPTIAGFKGITRCSLDLPGATPRWIIAGELQLHMHRNSVANDHATVTSEEVTSRFLDAGSHIGQRSSFLGFLAVEKLLHRESGRQKCSFCPDRRCAHVRVCRSVGKTGIPPKVCRFSESVTSRSVGVLAFVGQTET